MQFGQLQRRDFITLIGVAATAWALAAYAQQRERMPRIGFLASASGLSIEEAFRQGLRDLGYVEGTNFVFESRQADWRTDRLGALAGELVAAKVDVILAAGSEATRAAREGTATIPIVTVSSNPVGLGFVASLARPGGNITGLSLVGPDIAGKRLELVKDIVPGVAKIAALWNPNDPAAESALQETQAAAQTLGLQLQIVEARTIDAFDAALLAATREGAEALIVLPAPLLGVNARRIADLALRARLPTVFYSAGSVKAGGLISYGVNFTAIYRRAAYFVDRILKGTKPADLPIEQAAKFELAVNLKTAKALGLAVPASLLALADEVIE
jgi:putative ABC transport system substrate-binding protein